MVYEIRENFFDAETQKNINTRAYDPELPLDNDFEGKDIESYVPTTLVTYMGPERFYPVILKKYLDGEEFEMSIELLVDLFEYEGVDCPREKLVAALSQDDLDLSLEQRVAFDVDDNEDVEVDLEIPDPSNFIPREEVLYKSLVKKIGDEFPKYKDYFPYFAVIRSMDSWDFDTFHKSDKEHTTFVYFTNLEYDIDRRGSLDFLVGENDVDSILPLPNRLVRYDSTSTIRHNPFVHLEEKPDFQKYVIELRYEVPFE